MRRLGCVALLLWSCGGTAEPPVTPPTAVAAVDLEESVFERALAGDEAAIGELRDAGPGGLVATIEAREAAGAQATDRRWVALVDAVAQQRDATYSELYWYTELAAAREAAGATGKPILSLRLLGKLTDEYSCANSRFFRTALYSHPELAAWLRAHFVLHWSSERPVPKVTVDYGDGRVVRRTVTGNSAHYVLDTDGRPIDVLPGLYGPQSFRDALEGSLQLHASLVAAPAKRDATLADHHGKQLDDAAKFVHGRLRRLATRRQIRASMLDDRWVDPTAAAAAPRALTKAAVEVRLVEQISGRKVALAPAAWDVLAAGAPERDHLHPRSIELITSERPDLADMTGLVASLEQSVARDTARNEYGLRVRIHDWFARGTAPADLEGLNARVYSELFLTPAGDAWLGLVEPDVYTGLENNGVAQVQAQAQAAR